MLSQEDDKKLEEKSGQTSAPVSPILEATDLKVNSGNILTSKKIKNVTVPVMGLSFKITKG
tara:strand:- start:181 stop:363 length:183 start_codon:yes stop_codon:yes gene_type:complete